jgi:hypothetical protein
MPLCQCRSGSDVHTDSTRKHSLCVLLPGVSAPSKKQKSALLDRFTMCFNWIKIHKRSHTKSLPKTSLADSIRTSIVYLLMGKCLLPAVPTLKVGNPYASFCMEFCLRAESYLYPTYIRLHQWHIDGSWFHVRPAPMYDLWGVWPWHWWLS